MNDEFATTIANLLGQLRGNVSVLDNALTTAEGEEGGEAAAQIIGDAKDELEDAINGLDQLVVPAAAPEGEASAEDTEAKVDGSEAADAAQEQTQG